MGSRHPVTRVPRNLMRPAATGWLLRRGRSTAAARGKPVAARAWRAAFCTWSRGDDAGGPSREGAGRPVDPGRDAASGDAVVSE